MKFSTSPMTEAMEAQAKRQRLEDIRAFIAEDDDGVKEYVLYQGEHPIYANPSAEAIGAHLDIMWLARRKTTTQSSDKPAERRGR